MKPEKTSLTNKIKFGTYVSNIKLYLYIKFTDKNIQILKFADLEKVFHHFYLLYYVKHN